MISWHETPFKGDASVYARGWRSIDLADPNRLAVCVQKFVWSGCAWRGGVRASAHFIASGWCVMDFEDPEYTLAQAVKAFCDCRHVIGTTKSHGTDKGGRYGRPIDCFRVAIPWEHTITNRAEYEHNMACAAATYPMDRAARDPARLFYPCREVVSVSTEGYAFEVVPAPPPPPRLPVPLGAMTPEAEFCLSRVIPQGYRSWAIYGASRDLARAGFSFETVHARFLASPTFKNCTDTRSLKKMREAIHSAFKKESGL